VLHANIDWSEDDENLPLVDENNRWISPQGQPGFDEYYAKSQQIDYWRQLYMREALDWLKEHWFELWD
jgi:hypothetical protein